MADKLTRAKFAIRSQQAEKDFRMAEYYQRTGHPGSAVFYYELVRRRYAGTKYSDIATDRKEYLLAQMRSGKPMPGNDPIAIASVKWKELFSKNKTQTYEEHSLDEKAPVQTAGGGMPPANVVPAGGPFRQGP
jgi:hypothetical protein